MKVSFIFQSRPYKDGTSNLQMQFTNGRGRQMASNVGLRLFRKDWSKEDERVLKTHENATILNARISELKKRRIDAIDRFHSGIFKYDDVIQYVTGKLQIHSVQDFLESHIKETKDSANYKSIKNWLAGFKKYVGITGKFVLGDIDESLFDKAYSKFKKPVQDGDISPKTANNYIKSVMLIYNEALKKKIVYSQLMIDHQKYRFDEDTIPQKKANTFEEILKAIKNIKTVPDWQAVSYWMLMFAMRGLYPADLPRLDDKYLTNKKIEPNARNQKDWFDNNLYLKHIRSKSGRLMFIKLHPEILQLIEKLRYSLIYTHAGSKGTNGNGILVGIDNRIKLFTFNPKTDNSYHTNFFSRRADRFRDNLDSKEVQFKKARKSFEQTAYNIRTADGKQKYDITFVRAVTGRKLQKDNTQEKSYLNWSNPETIDLIDACQYDVMKNFHWFDLKKVLFDKLREVVQNGKAPKWVLKRSAVFKNSKGQLYTAVDVKDADKPFDLGNAEFEIIEKKYHKYFQDSSTNEDFWDDEKEPLEDSFESIEFSKPYLTEEEKIIAEKGIVVNENPVINESFAIRFPASQKYFQQLKEQVKQEKKNMKAVEYLLKASEKN